MWGHGKVLALCAMRFGGHCGNQEVLIIMKMVQNNGEPWNLSLLYVGIV
jgi:hypothetical protein